MYTVGQFARILGVSTKLLRHYDGIGLLRPARVGSDNAYRYYERSQVEVLKRILFLRDLGLSLEAIGEIQRGGGLDNPARLRSLLAGRAEAIRQEIAEREALLTKVSDSLSALEQEQTVPLLSQPAITIKEAPAIMGVGVRRRINLNQFGSLIGEAARKLRSRPVGPPMSLYWEAEFEPEGYDVEVLFPVAERGRQVLPATRVAAAVHLGPYGEIHRTYAALFAWVNEQGYTITIPTREIYLVGPDGRRPSSEFVTEIHAPLL